MSTYINKRMFALAVLFSLLAGLEMPFNTFSYSFVFYLIQNKRISLIVPAILLVVAIYAVFAAEFTI